MQTTKAKVAELETTVSTMNDSLNAIMAALGIKPSAVTVAPAEDFEVPLKEVMAAVKADVAKKAAAFSIEVVKADNPNKNAPKQPALPQQVADFHKNGDHQTRKVEYLANDGNKTGIWSWQAQTANPKNRQEEMSIMA